MYLEDFLSLPTATLIKDHLVNQEKDEVEYLLLSPLRPQVIDYYFLSMESK